MTEALRDGWLADDPLPVDPVAIAKRWLEEAFAEGIQDSPHAMALATLDADGTPSVRMVLCSNIDVASGGFTFHSNRQSRKGRALAGDPRAAIVFNWAQRQARVEGRVELASDAVSDAYFATRPLTSRLGAWASQQSETVGSRAALVDALEAQAVRFDARAESDVVPRPPHWGGFVLIAECVELWASRKGRIHDRALWTRAGDGQVHESWSVQRLQP